MARWGYETMERADGEMHADKIEREREGLARLSVYDHWPSRLNLGFHAVFVGTVWKPSWSSRGLGVLALGLPGAGLFLPFEAAPLPLSFAATRSLQPPARAGAITGGPPATVADGTRGGVTLTGGGAVDVGVEVPSVAPRAPGGRYAPPGVRIAEEPGVGAEGVGVAVPWLRVRQTPWGGSAAGAAPRFWRRASASSSSCWRRRASSRSF